MQFEKIDRSCWTRNEYFEHYFTNVPCTYSMTVKMNITPIKKKGIKLYPAMLYYIARKHRQVLEEKMPLEFKNLYSMKICSTSK